MLQNIDTDQIIPAEYLTLVPSKVAPICAKQTQLTTLVFSLRALHTER